MRFAVALSAPLLALALFAPIARASIVEAMSLEELTAAADVIAVVRVEDQRARYDAQGRIVTDVALRVEESLHGGLATGARTRALRLGGVVGDLGLHVEGEAVYQTGETILLFGRWVPTPDGPALRPIGMAQGVMPVSVVGGVELVGPGGIGLELVRRDPDGRLVPGSAALRAPEPREALIERIRGLVSERARAH